MKYLFLIFLIFQISNSIFGQSYSFLTYSIAEGLPQSQVSCIGEDEKGYLWVGTLGGLGRFNGSSFVNFSTKDGLLNNRISSLNCFGSTVWIGHEGGISLCRNGKIKKWAFNEKNKTINVSSIQPFLKGVIIGTNGGGLYYLNERNNLTNIPLATDDQNRIRGLIVINKTLYIATRGGLFKTTDLQKITQLDARFPLNISGIAQKNDQLILTTFDQGIFTLNLEQFTIRSIGEIPTQTGIRNCIVDSKGIIWIPSRQGILILDKFAQRRLIDQTKGLPLDAISTIFEDKNGTIWIGSEGKGLFRFPGEQFIYFNANSGIQSDLITAGIEISAGNYLLGTYDKGLIEYSKSSGFKSNLLQENTIWCIEKDVQGKYWLGTEAGLYEYIYPNKVRFVAEKDPILNGKIATFYKDILGTIWVGGANGIATISGGKIQHVRNGASNQDIGTIRNILKVKNQLFCAADGGLFVFKNGKFKRFGGITKKAFSLKTDRYDNLWIGTDEGFYWSDGKKIKQIYLSDQPASNFINFINYSENQVFVGTNNGLYVLTNLQKIDNIKHKHYGLEEGLVNLESNLNSSFVDKKGRLWFGTAQGLTVFDPNAELFDFGNIQPYLNIKSIKLNFQDFNYKEYASRLTHEGIPLNLVLPRSKNNLLIELDGVTLKNSRDLKYQYWLEGLDETWSPTFINPQVTLSNLPSGSYNLHVRAISINGEKSNEYVLFIQITPAFYATWWFFILMILGSIGIIVLIIQTRLRRERARNYQESLEFKARLSSLEQQSLNASMNRHFIFNSLNSIQYFINTQDKISANRYLTNFAKLIRKNLDSSTEDNNMVSLSQEIERLELYLSLESMRFRDRFEYAIQVSEMDTESILVPAMLFQPFVENSIIHGILPIENRKGKISIQIEAKGDYLEVILEDNGIGIDFSMNKKRQSEGDHRSQGMEITSKRIELLKKLSHRNFEMEGPYQIEDENHTINGTRVLLKIPCENLD